MLFRSMNVSKREKYFLSLLGIIGVITLVYLGIVIPVVQAAQEKNSRLETLKATKAEMDAVLANTGILTEEKEISQLAEENFKAFYTKLNSYNIDYILNALIDAHNLSVTSLNISDYAPVVNVINGKEITQEFLLKSDVSIRVQGDYQAILSFIDALNATTFCLQIPQIQIQKSDDVSNSQCAFVVEVYGVQVPN